MSYFNDNFDDVIDSLPPLNSCCQELLSELNSEDCDAKRIESMLLRDPVIAARTLHLANSSFYGFSGEIDNLKQAYIVLGKDTISQLVTSLYLIDQFKHEPGSDQQTLYTSIWSHSLYSAVLLSNSNSSLGNVGFIVSLFHYIGMLAIDTAQPTFLTDLKKQELFIDNLDHYLREQMQLDLFSLNRAILDYWKLPSNVVEGMGELADPTSQTSIDLKVCKFIASALGYKPMGYVYSRPISHPEMHSIIGDGDSWVSLMRRTEESFSEISSMITG